MTSTRSYCRYSVVLQGTPPTTCFMALGSVQSLRKLARPATATARRHRSTCDSGLQTWKKSVLRGLVDAWRCPTIWHGGCCVDVAGNARRGRFGRASLVRASPSRWPCRQLPSNVGQGERLAMALLAIYEETMAACGYSRTRQMSSATRSKSSVGTMASSAALVPGRTPLRSVPIRIPCLVSVLILILTYFHAFSP